MKSHMFLTNPRSFLNYYYAYKPVFFLHIEDQITDEYLDILKFLL